MLCLWNHMGCWMFGWVETKTASLSNHHHTFAGASYCSLAQLSSAQCAAVQNSCFEFIHPCRAFFLFCFVSFQDTLLIWGGAFCCCWTPKSPYNAHSVSATETAARLAQLTLFHRQRSSQPWIKCQLLNGYSRGARLRCAHFDSASYLRVNVRASVHACAATKVNKAGALFLCVF